MQLLASAVSFEPLLMPVATTVRMAIEGVGLSVPDSVRGIRLESGYSCSPLIAAVTSNAILPVVEPLAQFQVSSDATSITFTIPAIPNLGPWCICLDYEANDPAGNYQIVGSVSLIAGFLSILHLIDSN